VTDVVMSSIVVNGDQQEAMTIPNTTKSYRQNSGAYELILNAATQSNFTVNDLHRCRRANTLVARLLNSSGNAGKGDSNVDEVEAHDHSPGPGPRQHAAGPANVGGPTVPRIARRGVPEPRRRDTFDRVRVLMLYIHFFLCGFFV
jgi:hypothetical protein